MEETSLQEREKDLDKYYEKVFICDYCRHKFGCDGEHPTKCPICQERLLGRTSRLSEGHGGRR